jgi:hypothetical protein
MLDGLPNALFQELVVVALAAGVRPEPLAFSEQYKIEDW